TSSGRPSERNTKTPRPRSDFSVVSVPLWCLFREIKNPLGCPRGSFMYCSVGELLVDALDLPLGKRILLGFPLALAVVAAEADVILLVLVGRLNRGRILLQLLARNRTMLVHGVFRR